MPVTSTYKPGCNIIRVAIVLAMAHLRSVSTCLKNEVHLWSDYHKTIPADIHTRASLYVYNKIAKLLVEIEKK